MRTTAIFLAAALAFGCGNTSPDGKPKPIEAFKGLLTTPNQLAFTCVVPGCDTTLTVKVQSNLDRRVAIKRIILSDAANTDFTFTPSQAAPFVLGQASSFDIAVRFAPLQAPASGIVNVLVTYTDASPEESADRIEPGELKIPLVRRLVGQPYLDARPARLSFGVVAPGSDKTLPLTVRNGGFGNIALDVSAVDAGSPALTVTLDGPVALVPDAGVDLPVRWAPTQPGYLSSSITVSSSTPDVDPVTVEVEGTSIAEPRIAFSPASLSVGELPRSQVRQLKTSLINQGGLPLTVSAIGVTDATASVTAGLSDGKTLPLTLQPLERADVDVVVDAKVAGPLDAGVRFTSDDPMTALAVVPVQGTITEPEISVTPGVLAWGTVPMGWVVTKPIEIKNVGYGALTLKRIALVAGTSTLFTLRNVPQLPVVLERDQRLAIEIEFRGETQATFNGSVSIESDDPDSEFTEVAMSATAGSCTAGCPIANGTPACTGGVCSVGTCNTGYYNTDMNAANGCECREPNTDSGEFCSQGIYKGTLKDSNGTTVTQTGIVPTAADVDFIRFFAEDASQFLSEDFDVRISLSSSDPGISMCVYRHNTGNHDTSCYLENEACGIRSFRRDGSLGSDDSADYSIKVYRLPGRAPTCTSYTVFMTNG